MSSYQYRDSYYDGSVFWSEILYLERPSLYLDGSHESIMNWKSKHKNTKTKAQQNHVHILWEIQYVKKAFINKKHD